MNYVAGTGPFTLFLDLIGWSEENYGANLYTGRYPLGYVECVRLAAALTESAERPNDVDDYVTMLVDAEIG